MLVNAYELPQDHILETDVCVVGSGPAGMTLAREFLGESTQVCLLESGGLEVDPTVQELSEGETIGDPFLSLRDTRHRQVGGNSNLWCIKIGNQQMGVRYAPLDAIDFEPRSWVPYSGWAFPKSDLDPFYDRAQQVCQSGPYAYDADDWETAQAKRLPLDAARVVSSVFQFGPRAAFCEKMREELLQAPNITVCIYATVVELEVNESGRSLTVARVACLDGKQFWVKARVFVLAKGGLGNARLLLNSDRQQRTGLGNAHDQVGRYFMDHPLVDGGRFIPADPKCFDLMAFYDLRRVRGAAILGKLSLSPQLMRQEELLNATIVLFPRPNLRQTKAVLSLKEWVAELRVQRKLPDRSLNRLLDVLLGMDYLLRATYLSVAHNQSFLPGFGRGGWSELSNNQSRFQMFEVLIQTEQAPDPANRVVLASERDRLGCRKLQLHWCWGDINARSALRTQEIFAQELEQAGLGRIDLNQMSGRPILCKPSGLAHHIGTTRMHSDPKQGVVDENCQVHGLANLFIAGSSVFPTGGYANPTLTIVALSLRLADHLKQALSQPIIQRSPVLKE